MKQLTQKLKNGQMQIKEIPLPAAQGGRIIVRNHYSLISAGTETSSVKSARKGYVGKAKERPQQVKQVIDTLKSQGPVSTYRAVMKKLDAYSALGYSCAGEVIDVATDVDDIHIGDLVACGGFTASHAEIVSVPANLCVKLRHDADLKEAAYNTLGAIAMQGLRQADLKLGETCGVIGLGLLGQITALLLKASGVRVVGIDIDSKMVDIAGSNCVDLALNRNDNGIDGEIWQFTDGLGCDAVIITAGSTSTDPINLAGAITRKKGTIVVVGAVPTGFDREPHYYKKELQLKMSCSYGPGRYDPSYEEKGIDYPLAYVRWTEKRNMTAFQELLYSKKIDLSYLTTHIFNIDNAKEAYKIMMVNSEFFIGILLEYNSARELKNERVYVNSPSSKRPPKRINIGFIGAGSYAQSHLLPNIPKSNNTALSGIMTATGVSSRSVAERFGFIFCTSDEKDILENDSINTIFVVTRHDSHARFVLKALNAGKHVFVEKPLCLYEKELEQISDCYNSRQLSNQSAQMLMVGYNRRFSPLITQVKKVIGAGPMAINYRINSGSIPADSWIQDNQIGGGRILGEVCHFVDLLSFISGAQPLSVYANLMKDHNNTNDTVSISLSYKNGSIGTISYFANGDNSVPKERIEIYSNGCTAIIEDFKKLSIHKEGKIRQKRLLSQNKGQKEEVKLFIESILNGQGNVISFKELYETSFVTFKILDSIRKGESVVF